MDMYACDECGYYYDPEYGDEENQIDPQTSFDKLPSNWVCPGCGATKDEFCRVTEDYEDTYADYDLVYDEYMD